MDLTGDRLYVLRGSGAMPRIKTARRIGVDYAGAWKNRLLRFYDADSQAVTRHPSVRRKKPAVSGRI